MWSQSLFPCTLVCKSEYRFCYSESLDTASCRMQSALYKSSSQQGISIAHW